MDIVLSVPEASSTEFSSLAGLLVDELSSFIELVESVVLSLFSELLFDSGFTVINPSSSSTSSDSELEVLLLDELSSFDDSEFVADAVVLSLDSLQGVVSLELDPPSVGPAKAL